MQIIDFDAKFTEVLTDWIEKNRSRFRRPDDMENEVPDVYLRWLNTPAQWLDGATLKHIQFFLIVLVHIHQMSVSISYLKIILLYLLIVDQLH